MPTLEAAPYLATAEAHGIEQVLIATPNASPNELATIAGMSRGYTYVVTRAGVTGSETQAGGGLEDQLACLRANDAPPPLLGFGISTEEHVRAAMAAGARGAISGSAVVQRIADSLDDRSARISNLSDFVRRMKSATTSETPS